MATTWKAPTWRMPNEKNQNKFESYSIDFNGMDPLNCGNSDTLNIASSNYSISTWVKYTTTANLVVCEKGSNNQLALQVSAVSAGTITWVGGADYLVTSANAINDGNWHHVCCVAYGSSSILYIDGQVSATGGSKTQVANTSDFMIGGRGTSYYFTGSMSQLCLFDYDLSESQVSSLYNSGSPINPMTLKPAPVAYYPLGGNASTGGDSSNTLSVPNVAVPDASVFKFSSDSISVPNNTAFDFGTGDFTWSFWLNVDNHVNYAGLLYFATTGSPYRLKIQSNSTIYLDTLSNDQQIADLGIGLAGSGWHNLIFVRNSGVITTFLDGQQVDSVTYNYALNSGGLPLIIGNNAGQYFDGKMSNIAIWNSDQSSEISNIYNSGVPATTYTNTPTAWYKLDQSANWEADTANNWQIPDNRSAYPQSFDFDNTANSHIKLGSSLGNSLGDSYSGDLTLSLWFNADTSIINKGLFQIGTTTSQGVFSVRGVSGTAISFGLNQIGYTSKFNFSDLNNWHHLVCVYKGGAGGSTIMYLDGVPQTTTDSGVFPTSLDFDTEEAYIGLIYNLTGYDWDGKISNVQFWNTEIPATGADSVETLYNNGVPLTTAIATDNLKAWYKLDNTDKWNSAVSNWSIYNNKYPIPTPTYTEGIFFGGNYIGGSPSVNYSGMRLTNQSISTSHITYSFWYKRVLPNSGNSTGIVITNHTYLGQVNVHSNGKVQWYGDSATEYINFDGNLADGAWHHVLVYYPNSSSFSSDSVRAFIDGNEIAKSHPPTAFTATTGPVTDIRGTLSQSLPLQVELSNWAVFTTDQTSNIDTIYNGGTPGDISSLNPFVWLKYDSATTTFEGSTGANYGLAIDSSGNSNNGNLAGKTDGTTTKLATSNVIARQASTSSGMTEQNLVNNNVSALNGESSGMNTSNLVTSTLTRQVPYNSYSLYFDGVDDYIDCGDNDIFSFGNGTTDSPFTLSAWFKAEVLSSDNRFVISKFTTSTQREYLLELQSGSVSMALCDTSNSSNRITVNHTTGVEFETDRWYHIAFTYDGSATTAGADIYVDGVIASTATKTKSLGYVAMGNKTAPLKIGERAGKEFKGLISNVSIFNQELTSTDIVKIYNSGVPSDLSSFNPSPLAWWSLGSDSYFNGANYICPNLTGTINGTSNSMDANSLIGDAPNSSANGTSANMTIGANLTGSAPNSSNNSFSVNMSYDDRVSGSGDVPG